MNIKNFRKRVFSVVCAVLTIFTGFFAVDIKTHAYTTDINVFLLGTDNSLDARKNLSDQFYNLTKSENDFKINVNNLSSNQTLNLSTDVPNLCVFCVDFADNHSALVDKYFNWVDEANPLFHEMVVLLTGFKDYSTTDTRTILSTVTEKLQTNEFLSSKVFVLIENEVTYGDLSHNKKWALSDWLAKVCHKSKELFESKQEELSLQQELMQLMQQYQDQKGEVKKLKKEVENENFSDSEPEYEESNISQGNNQDYKVYLELNAEFANKINIKDAHTDAFIYEGIGKNIKPSEENPKIIINYNTDYQKPLNDPILDQETVEKFNDLTNEYIKTENTYHEICDEFERSQPGLQQYIDSVNLANTPITVPDFNHIPPPASGSAQSLVQGQNDNVIPSLKTNLRFEKEHTETGRNSISRVSTPNAVPLDENLQQNQEVPGAQPVTNIVKNKTNETGQISVRPEQKQLENLNIQQPQEKPKKKTESTQTLKPTNPRTDASVLEPSSIEDNGMHVLVKDTKINQGSDAIEEDEKHHTLIDIEYSQESKSSKSLLKKLGLGALVALPLCGVLVAFVTNICKKFRKSQTKEVIHKHEIITKSEDNNKIILKN